jgi:hypothetical protein
MTYRVAFFMEVEASDELAAVDRVEALIESSGFHTEPDVIAYGVERVD